jgi:nitroreductase
MIVIGDRKIMEIIYKRKSLRKYDFTPLDTETLDGIQSQIEHVTSLYPKIKYSIEITSKTKGLFNVKAPYYLVFRSEEEDGAYENIGFIGQQLDLYLSGSGLGSCWLGAAKPEAQKPQDKAVVKTQEKEAGKSQEKAVTSLKHIICMSFGTPAEPLYRELSGFKRKSLGEISRGDDKRLEAARLAPSGLNKQNWFFVAQNGAIHCYKKKSLLAFMENMSSIDMGIALCHIALESENFSFSRESDAPVQKGLIYMGTVR